MKTTSNARIWWPEEQEAWSEVEDLSVSEWADKYRILTYKAAKNGPWETSFNPVMRTVMDAFGTDGIEEITVVAPTQAGKTDSLLNVCGYWAMQDPGTTLIVEPNEDLASELSKDRVDDMIQHCDALLGQLSDDQSDTTKKKKTFKSMTIYFGWAGSPTSLASRPCRRVLFDEVNKYGKWTGEEASPLKLGKERTNTFIDSGRLIAYLSTPTTEEGYITVQERQAEARFRFKFTCPECGHKQQFRLEQIKWGGRENADLYITNIYRYAECPHCHGRVRLTIKEWEEHPLDDDLERKLMSVKCGKCGGYVNWQIKTEEIREFSYRRVEEVAWYECERCVRRINEEQRMQLVRKGNWYEIKSALAFDEHVQRFRPKSVGFQFNRINTPWFSFGAVAAEFLRCKDIPEDFMNFKNSWMAEAWVERMETKKEDELAMNRIELAPVVCPPDTLALTCGVDPGQGGFWYAVLAWTKAFAPHLVQHGFLLDFEAVRRLWFENVYQVNGLAYPIKIWRKGMDTGGSKYESESETMTAAAYEFLRTCDDGFTFGTKGQENMQAGANMQIKRVDSMPGPKGRPIPGGLPVWFLRPSYFKNVIQMRLNVKPGDPGRFTFNESVGSGSDYIKHLRGEVKQKDRKTGKWEWVPVGPNHLLDATVIAFALADPECFGGVRVLEPLPKEDIPEEAREEEKPESDWITGEKRKGGWI